MTKFITADKWLIGIVISGFVIYIAWTGFVVTTDRTLDYYVYVIAAHAFGNGENIYTAIGDPYSNSALANQAANERPVSKSSKAFLGNCTNSGSAAEFTNDWACHRCRRT
jgi:hypothetical protein